MRAAGLPYKGLCDLREAIRGAAADPACGLAVAPRRAHLRNCLALANSAAMAALAGAGLSWLEWRSLRGALSRGVPAAPRGCPPRGPSAFSPGVWARRMDSPTRPRA